MSNIEENKKRFISLCSEKIKRDGLDGLLDYLAKSDFFTSPASHFEGVTIVRFLRFANNSFFK